MYNIEDIKNTVIHGDSEAELKKIPDDSIGFTNSVSALAIGKKIDDLSCDDFKALYSGYTCKELKAMYKLEKDIKY